MYSWSGLSLSVVAMVDVVKSNASSMVQRLSSAFCDSNASRCTAIDVKGPTNNDQSPGD